MSSERRQNKLLTYVINTSENRSLDSDRLFDLAGYNKIRWLNCSLADVGECAQHIYEKQNVLGADAFRIATIVDFYTFDRIRVPYGRLGYRPEVGVDLSLYMPYIEVFLLDNLVAYLEKRELRPADFEVYYVQNSKLESHEFLSNAKEQLGQILSGCASDETSSDPENAEDQTPTEEASDDAADDNTKTADETPDTEDDPTLYTAFDLYCTPNVTLQFRLTDYPYGDDRMTFSQFFVAFNERLGEKNHVRRHYYVSNYGGGRARAAFDTLTLSLYLIRMYEREENTPEDGDLEIAHIDPELLKDILENAWSKVNLARSIAKGNNSSYYSLSENIDVDTESLDPETYAHMEALAHVPESGADKLSPDALYEKICHYHDRTPEELAAENREELDLIMSEYLERRDQTREIDVEAELAERIATDSLITTTQFPSEEDYLHLVEEKQDEISQRFKQALEAELIEMDYEPEKKQADIAYEQYTNLKALLHRNIIGDIIFMICALLSVLIPYAVLQLSAYDMKVVSVVILALNTLLLFGGLFLLAVILQIVSLTWRLAKVKAELRRCYIECFKKDRESMALILRRYREDLIYIERARYEIRQLKYLYEANLAKDANVKRHRQILEELEDHLSSMLNNLDVEPVPDPTESVYGEFDLSKPIRSRDNKVYRVFSIDIIDQLFRKKGRDEV